MLYKKLKTEGSFNVNGDGKQARDFIYVGDLAEFYVKAVKGDVKKRGSKPWDRDRNNDHGGDNICRRDPWN